MNYHISQKTITRIKHREKRMKNTGKRIPTFNIHLVGVPERKGRIQQKQYLRYNGKIFLTDKSYPSIDLRTLSKKGNERKLRILLIQLLHQ